MHDYFRFLRCNSVGFRLIIALVVNGVSPNLGAQSMYTVGASNSPANIELAEVTAATTFPDGRMVLLDGKDQKLYLVSRDGKRFKTSGRRGSGPGEFQSPSKVVIDASGAVLVFDPRLRRFSWFKVAGDSLMFQKSINISDGVRDFCLISDRLYTLGGINRPVSVYKVTATSLELSDSLGKANLQHPLATHPMIRSFAVAGKIGCSEQMNTVLWHSSQLDAGQVLSLSGQSFPLRLSDFSEVVMTPIDNGIRNSIPKSGVIELVRDIVPTASSQYFVVSVLQRLNNPNSAYRVRSARADGVTSLPTTVSARLHSFTGGIAVCEPVAEVPQVVVTRSVPSPGRYPCDNTVLKKP